MNNILNYFIFLRKKVDRYNEFISNPINYESFNNPFINPLPKTYVWIDKED